MNRTQLEMAPAYISASKELLQYTRRKESNIDRIASLTDEIEKAKLVCQNILTQIENYKKQYRAATRGNAKGKLIDQLTTLTGITYKNITVREVTAIGIQIRHDDGHKRIPYEELPADMQDFYQFDPQEKNQAAEIEIAMRTEHEASVKVSDKEIEKELAAHKVIEGKLAKEKIKQELVAKKAQITVLAREIDDLKKKVNEEAMAASISKASGKIRINSSNIYRGDIQARQDLIATLKSAIYELEAKQ